MIQVYDNPYEMDPEHCMGLLFTDEEPFRSVGSTVYFNSRFPTNDEIKMYPACSAII
jgi:hypothetical protein